MFTLSNPLLLWLFPLLALPWIFRRRQEERIKHINFPLIQFLRESEEKERMNPQYQEFLLLLLRTLLLALLLLALAGPKWISNHKTSSGFWSLIPFAQTIQNHLLVIDASYSMSYGDREPTWWQKTEQALEEVEHQLSGFSRPIIRWDRSTIPPGAAKPIRPLSGLQRDSLFSEKPTQPGTSVLDLFDNVERSFPDIGSMVLITDGQRYPWTSLLEGMYETGSVPQILVITVGTSPVTNLWCDIDSMSMPPWGMAGWETITGTVKALWNGSEQEGTLTILHTGLDETIYSKALIIPDTNQQVIQLPFDFTTQYSVLNPRRSITHSFKTVSLVLRVEPNDPLSLDNELHLEIPLLDSYSVGIATQDGRTHSESTVYSILSSAINPAQERDESAPITVHEIHPAEWADSNRDDLIVLSSELVSRSLAIPMIQPIIDYVKQGGAILVFTGGEQQESTPWDQFLNSLGWEWFSTRQPPSEEIPPMAFSVNQQNLGALSAWDKTMWHEWLPNHHGQLKGNTSHSLVTYRIPNQEGSESAHLFSRSSLGKGQVWIVNTSLHPQQETLLSPILPSLIWETGKQVTLRDTKQWTLPAPREESDLTLLSEEEKQFLADRYGIVFATESTLEETLSSIYGETNLRLLLLFICLILALAESWLSNSLASL